MKRPNLSYWWTTLKAKSYYVALAFPIVCLLLVLFGWDRIAGRLSNNTVTPKPHTEEAYTEAEYQQELSATLEVLQTYAKRMTEQHVMDLAKVNDMLYKQLTQSDTEWAERAKTDFKDLLAGKDEQEYAAFKEAATKRGKSLEDFKNTTFEEWRDIEGRVIEYERMVAKNLQNLSKNVTEAITEDPDVRIHKILSGPSIAFLVTFEKPWRVYINRELPKTAKWAQWIGNKETGTYALEFQGRVVIGYDMTKVKLYKVSGDGADLASYRIKLPAPEIKDVIFDYDKTEIIQMSTTLWGKGRMGLHGSQTLFRDLFSKTRTNQELFLRDFQANGIYDADFAQANICKTLEPYFKLQGNKVIIETTHTTFDEMIRVFCNAQSTTTIISLENR